MVEILSWMGAFLLAVQGIPQVYTAIKSGHTHGLNPLMLWSWFWGMVFVSPSIYLSGNMPVLWNYIINIWIVLILLRYTYYPKNKKGA